MPYYDLEIAFSKIYVGIEIKMALFFYREGAFTNYVDKRM